MGALAVTQLIHQPRHQVKRIVPSGKLVLVPRPIPNGPPAPAQLILAAMPQRRFPRPWRFEPIPGGYRVIDANDLPLAHVYGEPANAIAISDKRLTNNEAEKIARLIVRLPELVELERDQNRTRSRRKPQPLRIKPVTIGDLIKSGKLLEVHCGNCRPERHLYIDAGSLDLPKRMSVPEVANHLVCSCCGAKNSETSNPIWARPDAQVSGATGQYPDHSKS
jgi:hypothetical protein